MAAQNHRPTSIETLIVDPVAKQSLINWLSSDERSNNIAIVNGPHGCGKTTLVELVIRHCNGRYVWVDAADLHGQKCWSDLADKCMKQGNIAAILAGQSLTVLVIDNAPDAEILQGLLTHMERTADVPIICITDPTSTRKATSTVTKMSIEISVQAPAVDAMLQNLRTMLRSAGRVVPVRTLGKSITLCKQDLRQLEHMYQLLVSGISPTSVQTLMASNQDRTDLFDATKAILWNNTELPVSEAIQLFTTHRSLLAGMVHENFPAAVASRTGVYNMKLEVAAAIAEDLCIADCMSHASNSHSPTTGLAGLCGWCISSRLAELGTIEKTQPKIAFTGLLTKASVMQTNFKGVNTLLWQTRRPNMRYSSLQTILEIHEALSAQNRNADAQALLSEYYLSLSDLSKITRVNKIKQSGAATKKTTMTD